MIERLSDTIGFPPVSPQTRKLILRGGIILVELVVTAAIVYMASTEIMLVIPLVLVAVLGFLLLLRWPVVGLALLPASGMFLRDVGGSEINFTILLMLLLSAVWIVDMVIVQRRIQLASSAAVPPLLALAAVSLVAFVAGQFQWFTGSQGAPFDAQVGGLAIYLLPIAITLMVATQVRTLRALELITWVFVALGTLFVTTRLTAGSLDLTKLIFEAEATGGIFWGWFPAVVLGQAVFNRKLHPLVRLGLVLITLNTVYVVFVQSFGWKSGWVTVSIVIGTILALRSWRLGVVAAVIGVIGTLILLPDVLATEDYSISTRFEAWLILIELLRTSPILGLGFSNYYWYTPLYSIRGFNVRFNSHNNYVDIVAQTGLAGLACVLWFFVQIGLLGWRLRTRVPEGFAQAYVYSCLAGLIATVAVAMLGDWFLPFVYNIGMDGLRTGVVAWVLFGGLIAMEQMYLKPAQSVAADEALPA